MDLGLAGMISGAGNAGTASLAATQHYLVASQLQAERDKHDDLRAERLAEHQAKLQQENQTFTKGENTLTREAHSADIKTQTAAHSADTKATNENAKAMNEATNTRMESIAAAKNSIDLRIAEAHNKLQSEVIKSTELAAVGKELDSIRDSARGLDIEIGKIETNALRDPNDTKLNAQLESLQAAKDRTLQRLDRMQQMFEARAVAIQQRDKVKPLVQDAPTPAPRPASQPITDPFRTKTPGVIQTPMPSAVEQELMRKSLQ